MAKSADSCGADIGFLFRDDSGSPGGLGMAEDTAAQALPEAVPLTSTTIGCGVYHMADPS